MPPKTTLSRQKLLQPGKVGVVAYIFTVTTMKRRSWPVFYPDTLGLGGNCQDWGEDVGGLGAVPPAGSMGRAPGQGSGGKAPQKVEAFCCISSLFWSILEGIVEL